MRKILILLTVFISINAHAQKAAVQTAYSYFGIQQFDKAKEAIDQAALNESSSTMAKTWYYRAMIYHSIYESKDPKFAALRPGSIEEAQKSYEKSIALDTKKDFEEDAKKNLIILAAEYLNEGVNVFQASDYNKALLYFSNAIDIRKKYENAKDTLAMSNAILAADHLGKSAVSIQYYKELTVMNYGGAKLYRGYIKSLLAEKDTVNAFLILNEGLKKYPQDAALVKDGLYLFIITGKSTEAIQQADEAIKNDPTNADLYSVKGQLYYDLKKEADAETAYLGGLKVNPNHFDCNANLGILYFNQGANMVNDANKIPTNKTADYDAAKAKFDAKFKQAQPFLEIAYTINNKDKGVIQSLRQIYVRQGNVAKAEEMKKAMELAK